MKKLLLIVIPFLLIVGLGTVFGLNYVGILRIPFLPHMKFPPKKGAKQLVAKKVTKPVTPKVTPPPPPTPKPKPKVVTLKPDFDQGAKKLAAVWNSLDSAQLAAIIDDWKEPDLAKVLCKMDPDKVTDLLAAIDPKKASRLSKAIQVEEARAKGVLTST